jgi:TolB protein
MGAMIFNTVNAMETININKGVVEPIPIAITDFSGSSMSRQVSDIITSDLESSGLFKAIDHNAFIEEINNGKATPNFASWRPLNAGALVTGWLEQDGDKINLEFRLWDVFKEQRIAGTVYNAKGNNLRRIAHMAADEIYKRLTGEEGYFNTKLVYVAESGPAQKRVKRLAVMDYDGENHHFLTDGRNLVLTPRFSPSTHQIIYMSYASKIPQVYLRDMLSGREEVLGKFPGMTFAPRFSKDGKKVILSMAADGNTEIFDFNIATRTKERLTTSRSINTSPSYSPDNHQVVFNSDRDGKQHLYIMDANGKDVKRISPQGRGRYATPVWSPRGDLIAFTKWGIGDGNFYIGVMRPDGSGERLIAKGFLVESPTWAPNGRVLIYTKQEKGGKGKTGKSKLHMIDITGYNEREIITPMDASDPAWSPLL